MCLGKGVGDGRGGSEKRGWGKKGSTRAEGGDKIHSRWVVHLVRSRGAAAKLRNRALWALYRFSAGAHLQASLHGCQQKKRLRLSSQPFLGLAERTRRSI